MSDGEDWFGCLLMAVAIGFGGWWLYSHYEVRKVHPQPIALPTPMRPTGIFPIGESKDGSEWSLDTNSVKGPRDHRLGWVTSSSAKKGDGYSKTLYQVDCRNSEYRILSLILYNAKGDATFEQDAAPDKASSNFSPPGTLGSEMVDSLCLEGFGP